MRLTIRVLGAELIHLTTEPDDDQPHPGDCTTQPIGFAPSAGDQRWTMKEATEH